MHPLNISAEHKFKDGNEKVFTLRLYKGDIAPVTTEDGLSDDYLAYIILTDTLTGDVLFQFNNTFVGSVVVTPCGEDFMFIRAIDKADNLIKKMKIKGVIDLDLWTKVER